MTLRIVLTVTEIALLVGVLAYFLIRLAGQLTRISSNLEKIAGGVRAIEGHCQPLGLVVSELNQALEETVANIERAAGSAEVLAAAG